ncbi:hypothetical protein [Methanosarcina sp. DH2]|nr:hypothetical protein [Methanosarcina sp. DH2]
MKRLIYETIDACYSDIYPCEAVDYFKEYHNTEISLMAYSKDTA